MLYNQQHNSYARPLKACNIPLANLTHLQGHYAQEPRFREAISDRSLSYCAQHLQLQARARNMYAASSFNMACIHNLLLVKATRHDNLDFLDRARGFYLVLPFKLCPHASELHIRAASRADVVHDVDVDVIQHYHTAVCICC